MMMMMFFFNIEHDKAIDFVVVASHLIHSFVPEQEIFLVINKARQSKKKKILV